MGKMLSDIDLTWIEARVIKDSSGCWIWKGAKAGLGYGYFALRGEKRNFYAHRVVFYITRGNWPNVCRHTCDVYACCNPDHLVDGDHADNMRDAMDRGRMVHAKGEQCRHVLTEDEVIMLREEYFAGGTSYRKLAAKYGFKASTIRYAIQGKSWKHLE